MGNLFKRHHLKYKGDLVGFLDVPVPWSKESVFGSAATLQLNRRDFDRKTLKYLINKSFKILKENGYEGDSLHLHFAYAIVTKDSPITQNLLTVYKSALDYQIKTIGKIFDTEKILKIKLEVHQWNR